MPTEVPSRQEMFNRAWKGLKSQGWLPSLYGVGEGRGRCAYRTIDGRRCAWGWVDPEGTQHQLTGDVGYLARNTIGLAGLLSGEDLAFAGRLQRAHDRVFPNLPDGAAWTDLARSMEAFAEEEGLTIPEDDSP